MKRQQAMSWARRVLVGTSLMMVLLLRHTASRNRSSKTQQSDYAWWVDPDSREEAHTIKSLTPQDARTFTLVFSDEFNQPRRTFRDGEDPKWTAEHKNDCKYLCKKVY
jgi:Beta-glucan synthesis-associated protein SKN1/KRE6/Sbg1